MVPHELLIHRRQQIRGHAVESGQPQTAFPVPNGQHTAHDVLILQGQLVKPLALLRQDHLAAALVPEEQGAPHLLFQRPQTDAQG